MNIFKIEQNMKRTLKSDQAFFTPVGAKAIREGGVKGNSHNIIIRSSKTTTNQQHTQI